MIFTDQQETILNAEDEIIYVLARAGTGKTSTLEEYARRRMRKTFLYIVYTNSSRKHAKPNFPGNTTVHTGHSLAYEYIGKYFKHKLTGNLSIRDILGFFEYDYSNQEHLFKAVSILNTLDMFFNSISPLEKIVPADIKKEVFSYWEAMQDLNNPVAKMTQDGYLKLFQESEIDLNYDYIMIDEAQDINGVLLDVVNRQRSKKIFVGDNLQTIFKYRNTVNVFSTADKTYPLTKSFRFGDAIAFVANKVVSRHLPSELPTAGVSNPDYLLPVTDERQYTFISRTNAVLFDEAVRAAENGKSVHIAGGLFETTGDIEDTVHLINGDLYKIENPVIKSFFTIENMLKQAKMMKDRELWFLAKIAEKYRSSLLDKMALLRRYHTKRAYADVVFYTAHKAKGLGFENVKLADDFVKLVEKGRIKNEVELEELYILYVAITRAREKLEVNTDLESFLSF